MDSITVEAGEGGSLVCGVGDGVVAEVGESEVEGLDRSSEL